ncbi:RNA-guided endonuclease InsQ/TnpB family protein [Armatimonas sp.]|uniref:RNA-guided endonuclease InsQ/TnpB family protein n=1 Tax=Armatimonas sp. TaxID=1872638 RepID=UPI0037522212
MRKAFKYRLYPTKAQQTILTTILQECRWLYNHLLEKRKEAYEANTTTLTLYQQQETYPQLKQERPSLKKTHSQVLQNVALRLDLAMKAFFRRVKARDSRVQTDEKAPGYPRFRGTERYDSFTYPQVPSGCKLEGETLSLSKVGQVKVKLHRPLEGIPKTCTIKCDSTGKWWATFSCEVEDTSGLPDSSEIVGIDVGLKKFAFLSTNEAIANPKFFRQDEKDLGKVQRQLSKEEKDTVQRRKRKKMVARVHARIRNRRHNFTHQVSRRIINRFGYIAVEDIHSSRMVHNHCLAKSILDASWSKFFDCLSYKAECAGRHLVKVNPAYTSQDCHQCGHRQKMALSERIYNCPCCRQSWDRDLNASLNILKIALGQQCVEA